MVRGFNKPLFNLLFPTESVLGLQERPEEGQKPDPDAIKIDCNRL